MSPIASPVGHVEPRRRIDRAAAAARAATARHARSRRGPARPGRPGPWPSSVPARWACRWRPSSPIHGWYVIAVDIDQRVVASINEGRSHIGEEPGVGELVQRAHASRPSPGHVGRCRGGSRGGRRGAHRPGDARRRATTRTTAGWILRSMRSRRASMPVRSSSSRPRCRSGTRASGMRHASRPRAAWPRPATRPSGSTSRSRPSGSTAAPHWRTWRPTRSSSAGSDDASTALAAAFYESVLDAEVVAMSSAEAAEFSKLADTTYRDVNIALANEFARYADRIGVDITEVIAAANSQPYSHIHQPGIGVGGHCIPVYPHFLLDRAPELSIVARAREVNDGQVDVGDRRGSSACSASLEGGTCSCSGLTYRHGVKELAYSRAMPLIERLRARGAHVLAYDPLLERRRDRADRRDAVGLGRTRRPGAAIVTQTADPAWAGSIRRGSPTSASCTTVATASRASRRGSGRPWRIAVWASRSAATRATRWPAGVSAHPQRRRDATPAHQGGGAAARSCARGSTPAHRHGSALGRCDGGSLLPRARVAAAGP